MGYIHVEGGKTEAIKSALILFIFLSFFRTSTSLSIQKHLTPVILLIPSQHCLKCLVTSLRLHVSLDNGLVVHVLEATIIYLLPTGVLCIFGSQ